MTPRRALAAALAALPAALPLAGCGSPAPVTVGAGPTVVGGGTASLAVRTTLAPDAHGTFYVEGALAEVVLRGPHGRQVAVLRGEPGRRLTFRHLAPGRYTVEPALRPCEGSCAALDPRTDSCRRRVDVAGSRTVAVRFAVGVPCSVAVPAPRR